MGIGNPRRPGASGRSAGRPHYPSWGSETSAPTPPRRSPRSDMLITPHGDRKQRMRAPRFAGATARESHYPSWGSETIPGRGARRAWLCIRHLITPHGDRKPARRLDRSRRGRDLADLITPHGDRKRPAESERSHPHDAPHYPSWGSETAIACLSRPGRPRATSHYPSWGSETPISTGSDGSSVPFGDDHTRSRYGKWTRGPRFVRLSPGAEGVLCSGARCAVHTTDQFFPCQPSSC